MAIGGRGFRSGAHRLGAGPCCFPARISRSRARSPPAAGRSTWRGVEHPDRLRHRLPAGALGPDRPGLGEQRFVASERVTAVLQRHRRRLRPADRHRGGDPHRRRLRRHRRGLAPPARADARRRSWSSAARWAASSSKARSRTTSRPAPGPGLSGRGVQHPRRRRRLHGRLPRAGCGSSRSRTAAPTPTPAAPWSSRATAAHRRCRAGPSSACSSPTARRSGPLRRDADAGAPAPRHHPPTDWPEVAALAFDHRNQLEELAGSGADAGARIARFKALLAEARAAAPRARAAPAAPPRSARSSTTATARRRCRRSPAPAPGSPARSSCPDRGRWRSRPAPTWRWRCAPGRPSTSPSASSATTRTIRPICARRRSSGCRHCSTPASAPTASCWWR